MQLLDHVSITVRDIAKVKDFYLAIMAELGAVLAYEDEDAIGFGERNSRQDSSHSYFSLFESAVAQPDPRRHYCFRASSIDAVNRFYQQGLAHDGLCAGAPGLRDYHANYYAAFILDPEGNKLEAVFHQAAAIAQ